MSTVTASDLCRATARLVFDRWFAKETTATHPLIMCWKLTTRYLEEVNRSRLGRDVDAVVEGLNELESLICTTGKTGKADPAETSNALTEALWRNRQIPEPGEKPG